MSRLFLNIFFVMLLLPCFSQEVEVFSKEGRSRFPQFKFGRAEFDSMVYWNKRMPASALVSDLTIKVRVSFFVDTAGNVKNVTSTGYYYMISYGSVYNNDPNSELEMSEYKVLTLSKGRWTAEMLNHMKEDLKHESIRLVSLTDGLWESAHVDGKKTGKQVYTNITFHLQEEFAERLTAISKNESDTSSVIKYKFDMVKNQKALYNTGVRKLQDKMYPLAAIYFQQAIEYNPQDIDALYNLGIAYKKQDKSDKACEAWKRGAELGDKDQAAFVTKFCY